MKSEKIALSALHVASRPENVAVLRTLMVDGHASFLDLRSGSGLSNEGLRRRLEDLQRYHMIRGEVRTLENGVRVFYSLTNMGDMLYRLLLTTLDRACEMDAMPASDRFVLDADALLKIVRIAGVGATREIFARSKIILRGDDHGRLARAVRGKGDSNIGLLLNESGMVSIAQTRPKTELLSGVEQHMRKAKKLGLDGSDLVVTAMSQNASLITDNARVQSAARSMGIMSTGSENVASLRGTKLLREVFYEVTLGGDDRWCRNPPDPPRITVSQNSGYLDTDAPSGHPSDPSRVQMAASPSPNSDKNHDVTSVDPIILQRNPRGVFYSKKERAVYERLVEKRPASGAKFLGALLAFRQSPVPNAGAPRDGHEAQHRGYDTLQLSNPDKVAQSAHSIREALRTLLRGGGSAQTEKQTEVRCPRCQHAYFLDGQKADTRDSNRERIRRMFDPLGNLPDHFESTCDELHELHKKFVEISHSECNTYEDEYRAKLERFTDIMHVLLNPYYDSAAQIRGLIRIRTPKDSDLKNVEELIRSNTTLYRAFFSRADAEWLHLLAKDGKYFKHPASDTAKNNMRVYANVSEFGYLERTAASKPSEAEKIISSIAIPKKPAGRNPQIMRHLVRAGVAMPPEYAKKIAQKAVDENWHSTKLPIYIEDLAELMVHVAKADIAISLSMCSRLLSVTADDAGLLVRHRTIHGLVNDYYYEKIIREYVPQLASIDHDAVLGTICDILKESICIANKHVPAKTASSQKQQDASVIWRPAIEDHEQNRNGAQSLLAACIRDLLEGSEKSGIKDLRTSLSIIAPYTYNVFRRIEMHVYTRNPAHFSKEINRLAIKYFDDSNFKHEYYHMLRACYAHLAGKNKKLLLSKISEGPTRGERFNDDKEFEAYRKQWRIKKLDPIIGYLPEYKDEYDAFVRKHGRSMLAEFNFYIHSHIRGDDDSSQIPEDIAPKSMIKLLHHNEQDNQMGLDGLRSRFQNIVQKNPVGYSKIAPKVLSCRREFHYDFLAGISRKQDKDVDWRSVLRFCLDVVASQDDYDPAEFERIVQACANMLRCNLTNGFGGIRHSMRKKVWDILEHCANTIPRGVVLQEANGYGTESALDAMTESINDTTGLLTHAVIQYTAWHHSNTAKDPKHRAKLLPNVKAVLDSLLDPRRPQSVSAHAAFGYGLAPLFYSDREWTEQNLKVIFTHDKQYGALGAAAWDSYLLNELYEDVFHMLRQEYEYRIKRLAENNTQVESQSRLVEHAVIAYLHELQGSGRILDALISNAPAPLVEKCLEAVGHAILHRNARSGDIDAKIEHLLQLGTIRSNKGAGWLFVCGMTDKDKNIRNLDKILKGTKGVVSPMWQVLEKLKLYAGSHPLETIECVQMIIRNNKEHADLLLITMHLDAIFEQIFATKNESAMRVTRNVVDFLGRMGIEQFRPYAQ